MNSKKTTFTLLFLGALSFAGLVQHHLCAQGGVMGQNGSTPNPVTPKSEKYTPGIKWGGISLDDSAFYDIPTEKCKEKSQAEIISKYVLNGKVYIFKTDKGYGVADIELSYRDVETGVRRSALPNLAGCRIVPGLKLYGDIDCKGQRLVKKDPYEGCAYDLKIWGHSLSEQQAFELVYHRLQNNFLEYKNNCTPKPRKKTLQERMRF